MEATSFRNRIEALAELMQTGAAIIPSAQYVQKSNDTDFPFRQDSNFKYLVGFNEPNCRLVIVKREDQSVQSHLFLRDSDPFMEMWAGKRMGAEMAKEVLSVDYTYPIASFTEELPNILKDAPRAYFDLFDTQIHSQVLGATRTLLSQRKAKTRKPTQWQHLIPLVGKLRLKKDQNEILALKAACELTNIGHRGAMALAKPDLNEKVIANFLTSAFSSAQGEGGAYDHIVAGGSNALILHYIENNAALVDGDLLLIDAGAQLNTYASDVTRTFPVNGKYSSAQAELYTIVLESQKSALSQAANGRTLGDIHKEACKVLLHGLIDNGILKGSFDENMEKETFKKYYPHGTGHWLGLDVHDNCPYLDENQEDIKLEPGMVFTCEPGLYFPKNDPDVSVHWQGEGIRIEDDILMTEKGPENLTRMIPKEIKEVEEACRQDPAEFIQKLFS
jgi:Xaa-Pro aminopeptidase